MSPLVPLLVAVLGSAHAGGIPAAFGILKHTHHQSLPAGVPQVLTLSAGDRPAAFHASCTVGDQTHEASSEVVPAGESWSTALPAVAGVQAATCIIAASFANGLMERKEVQIQWTVAKPEDPSTEAPPPPVPDAKLPAPEPAAPAAPPETEPAEDE